MIHKFSNLNSGVNQFKSFIIISFFISIFTIGIFSVKDYGTTSDEYTHRFNGFANLNYIGEKFFPDLTEKYKGEKKYPKLSEYNLRFYGGAAIHAPMAFLEIAFGIKDKKDVFLFKHYIYFLIFFLSLISFFQLAQGRFSNWKLSLLGVLILFLSPRIFANSFYNNLDIPFMCFLIFSMNYGMHLFQSPNIKNAVLFSAFSAIAIDIRIMGIIVPFLTFSSIFFYLALKRENLKNYRLPILVSFFLMPFFIILFFPSLWEDPINNFISTFFYLANIPTAQIYNLYFGEVIENIKVPWHYIPIWILITTPIFYLILFFIGTIKIALNTILFSSGKNLQVILQDLFFLLIVILSLTSVIVLNSSLYNGWRHMYFVYPSIVMISLTGIQFFFKILKNKYIFVIFQFTIIFSLMSNAYWMIKNHPHQYVYFNKLPGNNIQNKFDVDYYAASYKENLDYLLRVEKKDKLYVWNSSRKFACFVIKGGNNRNRCVFIRVLTRIFTTR